MPKPGSAAWFGQGSDFPALTESERRQFDSILADKSFFRKTIAAQRDALRQVGGLRAHFGENDSKLDGVLERIHLALVRGSSRLPPPQRDEMNRLRSIAESGDGFAQYYLGFAYKIGWGLPQDSVECVRWLLKAAEQGHTIAQAELGFIYQFGLEGTPKDRAESLRWYRRAASQGDVASQAHLGSQYFVYSSFPGVSWPVPREETVLWLRKAAAQGDRDSMDYLGDVYYRIEGMQDQTESVSWFRKAANSPVSGDNGSSGAKYNLGAAYESGQGVPKDFVLAYMWFNLAATDKWESAAQDRDRLARKMSREQVAQAQELTQKWKPSGNTAESTGTGFFVSGTGYLVTNFHVVDGCSAIKTQTGALTVVGHDERNDLAVLKAAQPVAQFAVLSGGPVRIGQFAMVVGYPLRGLLSSGANVTTGNVSALAGPNDDTRLLQITAPVQPGNSGGPLLDQSGNVIGVVVSKLDTLKIARATGDIPQNINFAIKGTLVRSFLEAHGVEFSTATSTAKVDPSMIAEQASKTTVVVECWK